LQAVIAEQNKLVIDKLKTIQRQSSPSSYNNITTMNSLDIGDTTSASNLQIPIISTASATTTTNNK
jgi:hypothetical protein